MTHVASFRKNRLFDPISGRFTPIRPTPAARRLSAWATPEPADHAELSKTIRTIPTY